MQFIVCPICRTPIKFGLSSSICDGGHEFPVRQGILDFLPDTDDDNLLNEEEHWNNVAEKGRMKIEPNEYINTRLVEDYRKTFEECIKAAWSGSYPRHVCIVEIGCGPGSAIGYLENLELQKVDYVGIDVSIKIMGMRRALGEIIPHNWKTLFVRCSANTPIFKEHSLDIVFSSAALHHLNPPSVMEWVSNSLKPNGLFILHEPNSGNPFAKIGRKVVRGLHTKGEKPMIPSNVKQLAYNHNLTLVYENGLHFLTGSLQYLIGMVKFPFPFVFCVYHISRFFDTLITSPNFNYSFVQVYKKLDRV
jgi:SAM-dependent methyltransferase